MGRVIDISEFAEEELSAMTDLGTVRQEQVYGWGGLDDPVPGGNDSSSSEQPAIAVPLPDEETEPTEETTEATTEAETEAATEPTTETATEAETAGLVIVHDDDNTADTPLVEAPDMISLGQVSEGKTYELYAVGEGYDNVSWISSNENVATVSESGLVTFTGEEGEVTIQLQPNDDSGQVADSIIFSTIPETPVEEPFGGLAGGIWPYVLIALLSLIIIILLVMQTLQKKKNSAKAVKAQADEQRNNRAQTTAAPVEELSEKIHTEYIPSTPVPPRTPEEDAESLIQPIPTARSSNRPFVRIAAYQEIGARKDQQDSCGSTMPELYPTDGIMAIVADGMGGLANGKAVSNALVNCFLSGNRVPQGEPQTVLLKLAALANQNINRMLVGAERSGSTLVSAIVKDGKLFFLTVGDSRIYLFRQGALLQLNREHIYQEELALKAINCQVPMAQVTGDRQAKALTSFFGSGVLAYMDRNYEGIKLLSGDRIILCSDGVFGTLSQEEMENAMGHDIQTSVRVIRDKILQIRKPHQDNNTCVILEYI